MEDVLEAMELDANIHVYANDQGDVPATLPTCQAEDGHKENASADETVPMMVYKDERWMVPFEHMEHIRDLKLNTHGTPSNQEDEVEEEMPCDTMRCTKRSNKSAVVAITEECLLLNEEPGSNSQSSEHRSVCLQRLGQMLPLPGWKDLSADLVLHISDSLDLKCYASMRGTCTLWRSALAPPSPSLLVLHDGVSCRPVAASFPMGRLLELKAFPTHLRPRRCIGSSNGWLALSQRFTHQPDCCMFSLFNPTTATEICLPALTYQICWATKLVFTPDPGRHNLAAVVICDSDKIAWVTLGRRWDIFHLVCLGSSDCLTDMVYHDDRMVYCLTQLGDVYVLRLPERGQDAPAMVEPFLCEGHLPFVPVTIFGSTYAKLSDYFRVKNLVFCGRNLYQIWRNSCCRVTLQMPAGGKRSVAKDEILVLMYYPERTGQPCWDAVTELGGYSVFVGRNNAVSRYADDVPGLKGDCVYWISEEGRGKDHGMIFDMATGSSTSVPMAGGILSSSHSTLCWYFLSDMAERGRDIKH